jgi:hypothetical protein
MLREDSPIHFWDASVNETRPCMVLNMGHALSADEDERDLSGYTMLPAPVDHDAIEYEAVRLALVNLPDLQRRALELRFTSCGNQRVRQFAMFCKDLGVTQKQARILVATALANLRRELTGQVEVVA